MAQWIKQSTSTTITIGPAVDKDDGVTPETGLAAGTVDEIGVYKHEGTALVDISGDTTMTHRAGGIYTVTLDTGDTDTVGRLRLYIRDDSVCLPIWKDFMVAPANVFDSWLGTDKLQVDAVEISSDSTAADNLELITEISNITSLTVDASGHIEADVVEIEGADPTDQINAACDAAIETYGLDHLVSASVTGTDVANDSIIAQIVGDDATADWDTFDNTTDSLEALRNRGDAAWDTATTVDLNADQSSVTVGTVSTLTGHTAQTGDTYGELPTNFSDLSITVTTGRVDVASVEGSDATDQIRDAVVDDATRIDASALNALSGVSNIASLTIDASGHVEANVVETNGNANIESTYDLTEVLRILLAALAGKATGGGTTSVAFRDVADSKDRIAATVDANGNRTAITLDAS